MASPMGGSPRSIFWMCELGTTWCQAVRWKLLGTTTLIRKRRMNSSVATVMVSDRPLDQIVLVLDGDAHSHLVVAGIEPTRYHRRVSVGSP